MTFYLWLHIILISIGILATIDHGDPGNNFRLYDFSNWVRCIIHTFVKMENESNCQFSCCKVGEATKISEYPYLIDTLTKVHTSCIFMGRRVVIIYTRWGCSDVPTRRFCSTRSNLLLILVIEDSGSFWE